MPPDADPHFDSPKDVADFLLDITRPMVLTGDFAAFLARCRLPQTIGTFEGTRTLVAPEELRSVFENIHSHLKSIGAMDMRRKTIEANFVGEDKVQHTFCSQYVLRGLQLTTETVAHGLLIRTHGFWQISEQHYATANPKLERALASTPARPA